MKTAIVTGCSRTTGFGQHVARTLALAGFEVYATLRDVRRADDLKDWASKTKVSLHTLEQDVTSPESNRSVVDEVIERSGRIDVLVNNVGMSSFGALETLKDEHIREVMETNFFSAVDLTRVALAPMRKQGGGKVIFVSSMAGVTGVPGESIYCASKFALEGLAEALAMETARFGIQIRTIRPAFFNTGMSMNNTQAETFFVRGSVYDEFNDRVVQSTSQGEVDGENPQLVADMILEASCTNSPQLNWHPGEAAPQLVAARSSMDDVNWRKFVMSELSMSDWLQPSNKNHN